MAADLKALGIISEERDKLIYQWWKQTESTDRILKGLWEKNRNDRWKALSGELDGEDRVDGEGDGSINSNNVQNFTKHDLN